MNSSNKAPVRALNQNHGKGFFEIASNSPCTGCFAYCCRMLLIPHQTPTTFMDLDYILYMLGFPGIEMVLNSEGQWQVLVNQICGFLDQKTNLCTVHIKL
jgi:Fe-S-cluster containining protein